MSGLPRMMRRALARYAIKGTNYKKIEEYFDLMDNDLESLEKDVQAYRGAVEGVLVEVQNLVNGLLAQLTQAGVLKPTDAVTPGGIALPTGVNMREVLESLKTGGETDVERVG